MKRTKSKTPQTDAKLSTIMAKCREMAEFAALFEQARTRGYTDGIKAMLLREDGPIPRAIEAAKRRATFKLIG